MHRQPLLAMLRRHRPFDDHEAQMLAALVEFVERYPECFERSLQLGHVTGSAWVVDRSRTQALLTHHKKLERWLQLGGHADGQSDIVAVALREAQEESGLGSVRLVSEEVFDVDIHAIPATVREPEHYHYDVRLLFEADANESLVISSESKDLAWVPIAEISAYSSDRSVLRMSAKTLPFQAAP